MVGKDGIKEPGQGGEGDGEGQGTADSEVNNEDVNEQALRGCQALESAAALYVHEIPSW